MALRKTMPTRGRTDDPRLNGWESTYQPTAGAYRPDRTSDTRSSKNTQPANPNRRR
ncbi:MULTISPECIES: hypothetical protein [unclassified Streptomyces]|uniref:hypothetical protein n=1 Tax=unclassified Streptomyces TaxID=2593676 RepID=UPI0015E1AE3C|nr:MULTISPECIES: hypothetical protein [unclassified Streptomyces]